MKKYLYKDLYDLEDKHWWHIAKRKNILKFLSNFNNFKNPKILDIGCGTGKNLEELKDIGQVYGIDSAEEAIKYCKKRDIKTVSLENAESTKFPSNHFEIITLLDVLEHTNDEKTLKEINRIIKPGGLVLITVPAFPVLWSRWDVILGHKRRYTRRSLSNILKNHKFKIIKISYMFSFLIFPVFLIRLLKSKIFQKNYSSDFRLNNVFINFFLLKLSNLESFFISNLNVPFGTTIICIAKKL